ncbi:MAG: hypothetical protein GF416_03725 [Candidatus Altiarchaeales archaeon]|nr:hypothetical protein [Candidatus Altiarchaeales archaeon]MBD3416229.1 hypothetical protein [Candidatus Altiarchaeales archaeon]
MVFASACIGSGESKGTEQGQSQAGEGNQQMQGQNQGQGQGSGSGGQGMVDNVVDMATALASGQSYRCTYRYEKSQAETWIKGKKYKSVVQAEGMKVNTVSDGEWAYQWMEGETSGTKFRLSDFESMEEEAEQVQYQDIETVASVAVNVDCRPEAIGDSTFNPPGNVQFQDLGEMLRQLQNMHGGGGMPGSVETTCETCEYIPEGPGKQQCLRDCGAM